MPGITIPRNQIRTQTPRPSSASVDLSSLERAAAGAAETFRRLDVSKQARQLADAKAELDAGLADARRHSQENPDEFMEERFDSEAGELVRSIGEKYELPSKAARSFENQANTSIALNRVHVATDARRQDVLRGVASYNTRTATRQSILANTTDPLIMEQQIQAQLEDTANQVELGTMDAVAAQASDFKFRNDAEMGAYLRHIDADPYSALDTLDEAVFETLTQAQVRTLESSAHTAIRRQGADRRANERAQRDRAKAQKQLLADTTERQIMQFISEGDYEAATNELTFNGDWLEPKLQYSLGVTLRAPGGDVDNRETLIDLHKRFKDDEFLGKLQTALLQRDITKETYFALWNTHRGTLNRQGAPNPGKAGRNQIDAIFEFNPVFGKYERSPSIAAAASIQFDLWLAGEQQAGKSVTVQEAVVEAKNIADNAAKLTASARPAVLNKVIAKDKSLPTSSDRALTAALTDDHFGNADIELNAELNAAIATLTGEELDLEKSRIARDRKQLEEIKALAATYLRLQDVRE